MSYCPHCGAERVPAASFCSNCGQPLAEPTPQPAMAPAPAPGPTAAASAPARPPLPPAATGTAAAPWSPNVNWRALVVGNWLGAALTAGTALVVSGLLATGLGLLAKPEDFGWDNSLTMVAWIMTSAFGADLVVDFEIADTAVNASVGFFPLTVTVIALGAAVLVFRTVTARYTRGLDAVGDAVRASLLFALGLMVVALVFRADNDEFGRGWGRELNGLFDAELEFGASAAGAFFLGFLLLLIVLVATCFARRDWWPGAVQRVQAWLVAPIYGLGTMAVLLPVAGLIGLGLLMITGETLEETDPTNDDLLASIALIGGLLANGGFWLVSLGAGAAMGSRGEEVDGPTTVESHHLPYFADDDPGLWAAPVVMIAFLLVATYVVARKSPPHRVLANLGVWVAVVLVTTPLFVRVSSLHARMDVPDEDYRAFGTIGVVGWQATIFLTLATLVCALLVALMTRSLNLQQLRGQAGALGRMVQSNPGRPAPGVAPPPPPPTPPTAGPSPWPDETRVRPPS